MSVRGPTPDGAGPPARILVGVDVGQVRSVVLYRTPDDWRFAVCTTKGILDGRLRDTPVDAGLDRAATEMTGVLNSFGHHDPVHYDAGGTPDWWTATVAAAD